MHDSKHAIDEAVDGRESSKHLKQDQAVCTAQNDHVTRAESPCDQGTITLGPGHNPHMIRTATPCEQGNNTL